MLKLASRAALVALVCTVSSQALAQSSGWKVSEASGPVAVRRGSGEIGAKPGLVVQPGDTVITGAGGRAVLVHERDFVTVASNSRVRVPAQVAASGITRLFQELGNALFRIEKRGQPHFAVDTPYLAAVVKGTTFSITVGGENTSLQVTEGVVEVATMDGGARDLVRPGSIAMIAASDRYRLSIAGDQNRVIDSPGRGAGSGGSAGVPALPVVISSAPPVGAEAPTGSVVSVAEPAASFVVQEIGPELLSSATPTQAPIGPGRIDTIDAVIFSNPIDMGEVTGGMVTGRSPIILASAVTVSEARDSGALPERGNGRPADDGGKVDPPAAGRPDAGTPPEGAGPGAGGGAGPAKPDGGESGRPGTSNPGNGGGAGSGGAAPDAGGGKGPGSETPGKGPGAGESGGEKPGNGGGNDPGGEKPGAEKPDKGGEEKPDKGGDKGAGGEKPDGDKPGKGDEKPGEEKPGKGGEEKPDKGGDKGAGGEKPDSDKPGKGDEEKPDKGGDKGAGGEKPDGDKPGKGDEKPGEEKPGKGGEEKPDKGGDKGAGGEKPDSDNPGKGGEEKPNEGGGKDDGGEKPGKGGDK